MNFLDLATKRRSVRGYKDEPIKEEDLNYILESARIAPTGFNVQAFKIVIVKDNDSKIKLGELAKQPYIAKAPLILALFNTKLDDKYAPLDIAIVLDHVMLSACEKGIGSVFVGAYHNEEIKSFLKAPDDSEAVALMPLGYPADKEIPKRRKDMDQIVSYEKF